MTKNMYTTAQIRENAINLPDGFRRGQFVHVEYRTSTSIDGATLDFYWAYDDRDPRTRTLTSRQLQRFTF